MSVRGNRQIGLCHGWKTYTSNPGKARFSQLFSLAGKNANLLLFFRAILLLLNVALWGYITFCIWYTHIHMKQSITTGNGIITTTILRCMIPHLLQKKIALLGHAKRSFSMKTFNYQNIKIQLIMFYLAGEFKWLCDWYTHLDFVQSGYW